MFYKYSIPEGSFEILSLLITIYTALLVHYSVETGTSLYNLNSKWMIYLDHGDLKYGENNTQCFLSVLYGLFGCVPLYILQTHVSRLSINLFVKLYNQILDLRSHLLM